MTNPSKLRPFLESLRSLSLWDRLFRWKKVKDQLPYLLAGLDASESQLENINGSLTEAKHSISLLTQQSQSDQQEIQHLKLDTAGRTAELRALQAANTDLSKSNASHEALKDAREAEQRKATHALASIQTTIRDERDREKQLQNQIELDRAVNVRQAWKQHESNVQIALKQIALKHTIDYVEKVPFKGSPDNTLSICEQFVIFDAKSPGTEDAANFPAYLRDQAERAQKYTKQQDVKSDIFLVVPSNTLEMLKQFTYNFPDYSVFVIGIEALEPVIINLKRIEEYEFAKEMSPEDRMNICRILGRFAHLSKRRLQIDSFFARQFIELAYKSESSLPKDILDIVIAFEKAEKLNPPLEKRAKSIPLNELEQEVAQVRHELSNRGIQTGEQEMSSKINELPLYEEDGNE